MMVSSSLSNIVDTSVVKSNVSSVVVFGGDEIRGFIVGKRV